MPDVLEFEFFMVVLSESCGCDPNGLAMTVHGHVVAMLHTSGVLKSE